MLQQYLPFTVLKQSSDGTKEYKKSEFLLQQYLPFTVLKRKRYCRSQYIRFRVVATVLTVYGIETTNKYLL